MTIQVGYSQTGRMLSIATVLGEDALLLERLEIEEGVDQLFTIQASVRAQAGEVRPEDIVGTSADVRLRLADGTQRTWNGLVTTLHEGQRLTRDTRAYALTLRPRLWLMSQRSDCRIFLTQTTTQVLETLCREHGIRDYDLAGITGQPETQLYSVQWNEVDLGYLLRRLQDDGLFYYFRHDPGKHTLVVGDHPSAYHEAEPARVRLAFGSTDGEHIHDWRRELSFTPGRRAGKDYEFTTPNIDLTSTTPSIDNLPENRAYELYEYPARALTREAGDRASRLRVQAMEGDFDRIAGRSSVRTLAPGAQFTAYEVAPGGPDYPAQVILTIRHEAEDTSYEGGTGVPHYENRFATQPADRPATPHRTQPHPRIDGLQIAKIAGPPGEEIHTDEYGRVKLTLPWDRRARGDGTDTGWVRVTQSWGGATWGQQVIPRVGMEALVAYQEGDPDRPIVIGIAPNPNNPVPYDLPQNKTRMVLRSNSYKSKGFNEMTFEDATGAENMFFHAQKDHTTKIENNQTHSVGVDHANVVGRNQALTVGANQTQEIGGSMNLTVGGTGAGAAALMAPFAGMAGQTAGMLSQAFGAAMRGAAGSGAEGAAGSSPPATAGDSADGGGMLGQALGAVGAAGGGMGGITGTMMPQLASSLIGLLNPAGQQAQKNVGNGPSPRPDAGTALAAAGSAFGQAAGGLFSMGGILNATVGLMRNDSIGMAHVMQVGTSQAVNIGSTKNENVGKAHMHTVGEQYVIEVGKEMLVNVGEVFKVVVGGSTLTMDKEGNVTITGKTLTTDFTDQVKHWGKVIDLNPSR